MSLLFFWLDPWSLTLGVIFYLGMVEAINFPHHLGLQQYDGEERFLPYEQHAFTRSCQYPKWFARHVLLNFNLHTEHHLFPSYPWYQLDQLSGELKNLKIDFNQSYGNEWILKNRAKPVAEIFDLTFASPLDKRKIV